MHTDHDRAPLSAVVRTLMAILEGSSRDARDLCEDLTTVSVLQEQREALINEMHPQDVSSSDLSDRIDEVDASWGARSCEEELGWLITTSLRQAQLGQAADWRELLDAAAQELTPIP